MTLAGAHVRSICSELIVREHRAMCVDASMDLVVVGLLKNARLIVSSVGVFGMCSGDLIRTFGIDTIDPGHLSWSGKRGIRLTSDGNHVMFAEGEQGRLTLFTLTGELVRCINTFDFSCGEPVDVSFTRAGDIVVADHWCRGDGRSLFVLTPDGSSLLQSFGSRDRFVRASALAVHGGLLYALDQRKGVHVFN